MPNKENPLFRKKEPTPAEVQLFASQDMMSELYARYPEWAVEKGYVKVIKKKRPGLFSRLIGRGGEEEIEEDDSEEIAEELGRRAAKAAAERRESVSEDDEEEEEEEGEEEEEEVSTGGQTRVSSESLMRLIKALSVLDEETLNRLADTLIVEVETDEDDDDQPDVGDAKEAKSKKSKKKKSAPKAGKKAKETETPQSDNLKSEPKPFGEIASLAAGPALAHEMSKGVVCAVYRDEDKDEDRLKVISIIYNPDPKSATFNSAEPAKSLGTGGGLLNTLWREAGVDSKKIKDALNSDKKTPQSYSTRTQLVGLTMASIGAMKRNFPEKKDAFTVNALGKSAPYDLMSLGLYAVVDGYDKKTAVEYYKRNPKMGKSPNLQEYVQYKGPFIGSGPYATPFFEVESSDETSAFRKENFPNTLGDKNFLRGKVGLPGFYTCAFYGRANGREYKKVDEIDAPQLVYLSGGWLDSVIRSNAAEEGIQADGAEWVFRISNSVIGFFERAAPGSLSNLLVTSSDALKTGAGLYQKVISVNSQAEWKQKAEGPTPSADEVSTGASRTRFRLLPPNEFYDNIKNIVQDERVGDKKESESPYASLDGENRQVLWYPANTKGKLNTLYNNLSKVYKDPSNTLPFEGSISQAAFKKMLVAMGVKPATADNTKRIVLVPIKGVDPGTGYWVLVSTESKRIKRARAKKLDNDKGLYQSPDVSNMREYVQPLITVDKKSYPVRFSDLLAILYYVVNGKIKSDDVAKVVNDYGKAYVKPIYQGQEASASTPPESPDEDDSSAEDDSSESAEDKAEEVVSRAKKRTSRRRSGRRR